MLVLALALMPLPALANEPAAAPPSKNAQPAPLSLRQVIARDAARIPLARTPAARKNEQASPASGSGSFLRSRTGVLAVLVLAAGGGYAVYSVSHDRVKSAGKN